MGEDPQQALHLLQLDVQWLLSCKAKSGQLVTTLTEAKGCYKAMSRLSGLSCLLTCALAAFSYALKNRAAERGWVIT